MDDSPDDRQSVCRRSLEPIGVWVKRDGEWSIIHRCCTCSCLKTNRIAGDDLPWALIALAAKALARPPFPIDAAG